MATNAQRSTAGRTGKAASASATAAQPASRPADQRAEPQAKAGQTKPTKPPAQQPRQDTEKPKRRSYHTEIAALADATAELPPPWRQRTIHIVHGIVDPFERAWRELRRRPLPVAAEVASPADAADPRPQIRRLPGNW